MGAAHLARRWGTEAAKDTGWRAGGIIAWYFNPFLASERVETDPPRQSEQSVDSGDNSGPRYDSPNIENSPYVGSSSASTTVVVFCHLMSAECRKLLVKLSSLDDGRMNSLRIAFKHFSGGRENLQTRNASLAAAAAHEQGKFWKYCRKHIDGNLKSDLTSLKSSARAVGLDLKRFSVDLGSKRIADIIQKDENEALALGITSTPAAYVEGTVLIGQEALKRIDDLIGADSPGVSIEH